MEASEDWGSLGATWENPEAIETPELKSGDGEWNLVKGKAKAGVTAALAKQIRDAELKAKRAAQVKEEKKARREHRRETPNERNLRKLREQEERDEQVRRELEMEKEKTRAKRKVQKQKLKQKQKAKKQTKGATQPVSLFENNVKAGEIQKEFELRKRNARAASLKEHDQAAQKGSATSWFAWLARIVRSGFIITVYVVLLSLFVFIGLVLTSN